MTLMVYLALSRFPKRAVVANLSLVMGYGKRQAEPADAFLAQTAATPKNGLLSALLDVWSRLFAGSEPAWA